MSPKPATPRPKVRTDVFGSAPDAPEPAEPRKTVRTAAFAESPPADSRPAAPRHRGSAKVGGFAVEPPSFEEPASPEPRRSRPRDKSDVELASFGNAAADEREPGPTKAAAVVRAGGFGDGVAEAQPRKKRSRPVADPDTPVEILSKPAPVYTAEAKSLKIEGEVVLKVVFVSSGKLQVLDVVSRLGHGLDEAAIEAAKKIRFKPARRDGQPVDHTAVLRIVFQLV